ncbi:MAG: dihydrofolate reductase [Fuerstiella sp.]
MIIISALSSNRVIGSGNGMPWEVPEEYQHFLDTTRDQALIIGRKSFEIFGPSLTCRHCFVVTRSNEDFTGAVSVNSFEEAARLAADTGCQVFVAGGASIYAMAITRADRMLLSYIPGDFEGDTLFPEIPEDLWQVVSREDRGSYELLDYRRRDRPAS